MASEMEDESMPDDLPFAPSVTSGMTWPERVDNYRSVMSAETYMPET